MVSGHQSMSTHYRQTHRLAPSVPAPSFCSVAWLDIPRQDWPEAPRGTCHHHTLGEKALDEKLGGARSTDRNAPHVTTTHTLHAHIMAWQGTQARGPHWRAGGVGRLPTPPAAAGTRSTCARSDHLMMRRAHHGPATAPQSDSRLARPWPRAREHVS
jgi:hypothetical protein